MVLVRILATDLILTSGMYAVIFCSGIRLGSEYKAFAMLFVIVAATLASVVVVLVEKIRHSIYTDSFRQMRLMFALSFHYWALLGLCVFLENRNADYFSDIAVFLAIACMVVTFRYLVGLFVIVMRQQPIIIDE